MYRRLLPASRIISAVCTVNPVKQQLFFRTQSLVKFQPNVRYFTSNKDEVPDEFFEKDVESDKEFLDTVTSLKEGGLENLSMTKSSITWDEIDVAIKSPFPIEDLFDFEDDDDDDDETYSLNNDGELTDLSPSASPSMGMAHDSILNQDVADHIAGFGTFYVPEEMLNPNLPWKKTDIASPSSRRKQDQPETVKHLIEKFIPLTAPEKFTHTKQGLRHCPGHRQRRGKLDRAKLECHLIDLQELTYLDVVGMRRYISDDSEILGRKITGLCAKCQRKVAKSIKRARNFGLMPHLGEFVLQDSRPLHQTGIFHDAVRDDELRLHSKTIL
jgi:small subunit ribosomal protein S18